MFGVPNTTAPAGSNGGGFAAGSGLFSLGGSSGTASFGGFGLPATGNKGTAAPAAASTGFNFGAAGTKFSTGTTSALGSFTFGTPQQPQTGQTAAAGTATGLTLGTAVPGTVSFGRPSVPAATSASPFAGFGTPATTASNGSLLGGLLSSATSTSAPATTAAAAPSGGFTFGTMATTTAASGGFSFGATATPVTTTATTTATQLGFTFGSTATQPVTSASTQASGIALGNIFGTSPASTQASGATLGNVFGTSTASTMVTTNVSVAPVSTATAGASVVGQKQMTFRQLEESINKWTNELEEQEKYFLDQATQVNAWDRIVMENGEKIVQLNKDVEKVKLDQQKLDLELDFIHSQQRELEELLIPLENSLDSLPPISYQQHADIEREHTYTLAETLDAQLKHMGQDLKEIIERLNSTNSAPDPNDPVQQITKILNAHVVSLMWVERNTNNLQHRVEEISKQVDQEKRDQEKNFRLAYS